MMMTMNKNNHHEDNALENEDNDDSSQHLHLQPPAHNGTNGAATIVEERKLRVCPEVMMVNLTIMMTMMRVMMIMMIMIITMVMMTEIMMIMMMIRLWEAKTGQNQASDISLTMGV